jgi:hypothetical protein
MVRKIIVILLTVILLSMCGGCLRKKPGVRVVDRILVQWEENGHSVYREHDDPEKMQLILNKVRMLGQRFSSETDPETLDVPTVTMTLLYSDGSQRQYQIKPDRYVRIGRAAWQQANPKQITSLRLLLLSLPDDSHS